MWLQESARLLNLGHCTLTNLAPGLTPGPSIPPLCIPRLSSRPLLLAGPSRTVSLSTYPPWVLSPATLGPQLVLSCLTSSAMRARLSLRLNKLMTGVVWWYLEDGDGWAWSTVTGLGPGSPSWVRLCVNWASSLPVWEPVTQSWKGSWICRSRAQRGTGHTSVG